jgi:Microfibril-associated/Pre-mRNA processing
MANNATSRTSDFGRAELNALLGGGLSERLVRPAAAATAPTSSSLGVLQQRRNTKDVADLTVEETAALLLEEQKKKKDGAALRRPQDRLRAETTRQRKKTYHDLLEEEMARQLPDQQKRTADEATTTAPFNNPTLASTTISAAEGAAQPDESEFVPSKQRPAAQLRVKAAPVVIVGTKRTREFVHQSDSSDSEDSGPRKNAPLTDSSDDDDDDSAVEQRRARLRAQRQERAAASAVQEQPAAPAAAAAAALAVEKSTMDGAKETHDPVVDAMHSVNDSHMDGPRGETETIEPTKGSLAASAPSQGHESNDSDETSSSSSSDSSSSDDEPQATIIRPKFVPRHQRGLVATLELERLHQEQVAQKQVQQTAQRQLESRAMVQQIVTSSQQQQVDNEPSLVGLLLATDDVIPNDDDYTDSVTASRDEWIVRELERLLYDWDQEQERIAHERVVAP